MHTFGRKVKTSQRKRISNKITDIVESVKHDYAARLSAIEQQNRLVLETSKQRHELRLAAIDKRLAAHQEAYALWWKLMFSGRTAAQVGPVVLECQEWLVHNRLYLKGEVAVAFMKAYMAAHLHPDLLTGRADSEALKSNWADVTQAGSAILEAIDLPALTASDVSQIRG